MAQTDQVLLPDVQSSQSAQPPVITDDDATPDPQSAQLPVITLEKPRKERAGKTPVITDDDAIPGWVGYATWACLVVILLGVSVGGLVSTTVTWVDAGAVLLVLSPVLIPLGILFIIGSLIVLAFLTSVSVFVAPLIWLIRYSQGKRPYGSDQVDTARHRIAGSVQSLTGWTFQPHAAPSA